MRCTCAAFQASAVAMIALIALPLAAYAVVRTTPQNAIVKSPIVTAYISGQSPHKKRL
jgi:hypothetical protein